MTSPATATLVPLTLATVNCMAIEARLMERAYAYERRTGRRPETLNLTRSEYQTLLAGNTGGMYGTFGTSPKPGCIKPRWRGFKLRVRNYVRERMVKEARVADGMVRIPRRKRRTITLAQAMLDDAFPHSRMRLVP